LESETDTAILNYNFYSSFRIVKRLHIYVYAHG